MWHAGALVYTERGAPRHRPLRQEGVEEAQMAGGGGDAEDFGKVLPGLWETARYCHLVQVPGTGYYGGRRQLAGGDKQLNKGSEELDADDEDPGPGVGIPEHIRFFFKLNRPGSVVFWFGDVGPDPPYGSGLWKFPEQVLATDHWEAANEARGGGGGYPPLAVAMEELVFWR